MPQVQVRTEVTWPPSAQGPQEAQGSSNQGLLLLTHLLRHLRHLSPRVLRINKLPRRMQIWNIPAPFSAVTGASSLFHRGLQSTALPGCFFAIKSLNPTGDAGRGSQWEEPWGRSVSRASVTPRSCPWYQREADGSTNLSLPAPQIDLFLAPP